MKAMNDGYTGAIATAVDEAAEGNRKRARRLEKAEARIRLQGALPPEPFDRFRIITECISEARQVVDLSDHRARYALVIIGVLNAGVFVVISRAHLLAGMSPAVKSWLVGMIIVYGLLTMAFVLHAIECLRPRTLDSALSDAPAPPGAEPLGLLFWEVVGRQDLDTYHKRWDRVRMVQINREAEAVFHTMAGVVRAKYRALHRLYLGLIVLVILATLVLGVVTWVALLEPMP
jgi:hypothetical protein